MSTSIIPAGFQAPVVKFQQETDWDSIVANQSYLPYVQLCGGSSALAKEGLIGIGRYALVRSKKNFVNLGAEFDCVPIMYRLKAIRFGDEVLAYYNPHSEAFKQIMVESEQQDSQCAYGPDFLLWLPDQRSFATFLFGSKSARNSSPALKDLQLQGKAATLKSELVSGRGKNAKNKWHVPVIVPCSTPLVMPDVEKLTEVCAKFANPQDSEVEVASENNQSGRPQ